MLTEGFFVPKPPKSWKPTKGLSAAERALELYLCEVTEINAFSVPVIANVEKLIDEHPLVGYVDSDFAGEKVTRKSRSGYIFLFNGAPVAWFSKLQTVIAQSTLESETVSANEAVRELLALRQCLRDIGLPIKGFTPLFEDNEGTIILSKRGLGESRTNHIDVRYHLLEKLVKKGVVKLFRVPTEENIADLFTKINFT